MTLQELMNINPEAYKYKRSAAPSRHKWQLNDIFPINYILYTHNFYSNVRPRTSSFELDAVLFVKICAAISKPWQVKHEINTEIGITVFC